MSYPTHTTWERLRTAVEALASGTESLQERLYSAALALTPLKIEEFPEELRDRVPLVSRPGVQNFDRENLKSLSDEDARKLAEEIVSIYDNIAREYCVPDER